MSALLKLSEVSFYYSGRTIFSGLNAAVREGDCIALIGPNGAGKTTLLRLAAGALRAASGQIDLRGRPLHALKQREIARQIALVPQQVEMPFAFTVQQFVEQGRTPYLRMLGGLSEEDSEAVERALHLTDTASMRWRIFNQLSGGEKQRVKIALGLAQEPGLLLLDEPMQHLDIGRQFETIELIRRLHGEGITILAAMHDLALIEGTFRAVWMLSPNEPMRQGSPQQLLQPELLERVFDCPPNGQSVAIHLTGDRRMLAR